MFEKFGTFRLTVPIENNQREMLHIRLHPTLSEGSLMYDWNDIQSCDGDYDSIKNIKYRITDKEKQAGKMRIQIKLPVFDDFLDLYKQVGKIMGFNEKRSDSKYLYLLCVMRGKLVFAHVSSGENSIFCNVKEHINNSRLTTVKGVTQ